MGRWFGAAMLGLVACGGTPAGQVQTVTEAEVTLEFPAVGRLTTSACTATLIHRQTILTAAHCLDEGGLGSFVIEGPGGELAVSLERVTLHPGYRGAGVGNGFYDIAVGVLAHPVELAPQPLRWAPVRTGDRVRLVGYGRPAVDGAIDGRKRTAIVDVERGRAQETQLRAASGEAQTCPGDSGSPYLDPETAEVMAVHRAGDCVHGGDRSFGVPILLHRSFIQRQLHDIEPPETALHPLIFDPELYAHLHPELAPGEVTSHWMQHGWTTGERGSATFDPAFYRVATGQVGASSEALAGHWLEVGIPAGQPASEEVDPTWLRAMIAAEDGWPLEAGAHATALHHHVDEDLYYWASATYDPSFYMTSYDDWVTEGAIVSYRLAFAHYLRVGKLEGRRAVDADQ